MSSRILFLSLLLLPGLALAQAGRFILAVGDVVVARGAAEIRAGVGTPVETGDTIRVGVNSNAQVRLSDESILGLRSGTVLRLDEYAWSGTADGRERSIFSLLKGGFRTVTGAIGRLQSRDRYAVRTPTATVGIRGTHYTLVHCDDDCAASPTASGGQTTPGAAVPNGTYGGVSDGRIGVENATGERLFGANEYFHVASQNTPPQSLIAPPSFLYDRLAGQSRNQGEKGQETSENMAQSGMNAESRPSDTPVPPTPNEFIVTEQRTPTGESVVVGATRFDTAALGFWSQPGSQNQDGGGALVQQSALTLGSGGVPTAFKIPENCVGPNENCTSAPSGSLPNAPIQQNSTPFPGSTQVVFWGRWNSGTITDDGQTFSLSSTHQAHLMYAPLTPMETIASKSGTLLMTTSLSNGTTPTTNQPSFTFASGSFPNIHIDFTHKTATLASNLSLSFQFSVNQQNWSLNSGPSGSIHVQNGGAFFQIQGTGTCASVGGSFCNGLGGTQTATFKAGGIFIGPAGDHAGVALSGSSGTSNMGTVRLYCPTC